MKRINILGLLFTLFLTAAVVALSIGIWVRSIAPEIALSTPSEVEEALRVPGPDGRLDAVVIYVHPGAWSSSNTMVVLVPSKAAAESRDAFFSTVNFPASELRIEWKGRRRLQIGLLHGFESRPNASVDVQLNGRRESVQVEYVLYK